MPLARAAVEAVPRCAASSAAAAPSRPRPCR